MGREISTLKRTSLFFATLVVAQFSQLNAALAIDGPPAGPNFMIPKAQRPLEIVSGGGQRSSGGSTEGGPPGGTLPISSTNTFDISDTRETDNINSSICDQPFIRRIGNSEVNIESWLQDQEPIGAASDVTVLSNHCPVATGFMRYDLGGFPMVRAFRWEWKPNSGIVETRLSPSQFNDPSGPSNAFPNNSPSPLSDYITSIDVPLWMSADGSEVSGSAQFWHPAYGATVQQKQGFLWTKLANAQSFNLLPDLPPNAPDGDGPQNCVLSSAAYSVTETASNTKIVGQGTSLPHGLMSDGACNVTNGKAVSIAANGQGGLDIIQTRTGFSYASAVSSNGRFVTENDLQFGRSIKSYLMDTDLGSQQPLRVLPNDLWSNYRKTQAETLVTTGTSPQGVRIFGHSNLGSNPNSPTDMATSAVIWNHLGNIIRSTGTSLPGMGGCDSDGLCARTEARDGTPSEKMVGVAFLAPGLYPEHPCRLAQIAPSMHPRLAFIYTPGTGPNSGIKYLKDYAYASFPSNTPAGIAAREELEKWTLCEALSIHEGEGITISGIGVRNVTHVPGAGTTEGFVIHLPKITTKITKSSYLLAEVIDTNEP